MLSYFTLLFKIRITTQYFISLITFFAIRYSNSLAITVIKLIHVFKTTLQSSGRPSTLCFVNLYSLSK